MNNKEKLSKYWVHSINSLLGKLKLDKINPETFTNLMVQNTAEILLANLSLASSSEVAGFDVACVVMCNPFNKQNPSTKGLYTIKLHKNQDIFNLNEQAFGSFARCRALGSSIWVSFCPALTHPWHIRPCTMVYGNARAFR